MAGGDIGPASAGSGLSPRPGCAHSFLKILLASTPSYTYVWKREQTGEVSSKT